MSSLGDKIYSGAADYGKIRSGLNLFIGVIVSIALLIFGIYIIRKPKVYVENVIGKVKSSTCLQIQQNKEFFWNCSMNIDYEVKNTKYNTDIVNRSSIKYNPDDNIDLYHEVNNPRKISADKDDSNLGWILVGISLLIMIFLIVNFILTLYSTTYASVVGVTSATGDIIGAFKN